MAHETDMHIEIAQLVMQGSPLLSQFSFCDQPFTLTSDANEEGEIESDSFEGSK